jgi:hypothetical protein
MYKRYSAASICIIILFLCLSFNQAIAKNLTETEIANENIDIEYAIFNENGELQNEIMTVSEEDYIEIQDSINNFMEEASKATCFNDFKNIVRKFLLACKYPILFKIFSSLYNLPYNFRRPVSREIVISHGWGYKMNPLKHSDIKIYRPLTFWHYSARSLFPSRTIILRMTPFDMKILSGRQMGFMTQFTGLYVYIARQLPQQSYTAFIGFTTHAVGFDTSLAPIFVR